MTTYATPLQPLTARIFMFGGKEDAVAALSDAMTSGDLASAMGGALKNVSEGVRNAAVHELSTVSADLLDLDLASVLVAGWCKYSALTAAARRTVAAPGSEELVEIVSHRITAAHHPYVELLVNGVRVTTVDLGLELQFDIKALVAAVRSGKLVALHSGKCDITATLSIENINVATRHGQIELPLAIQLEGGVPLLSEAQHRAATR